MFYQAIIIIIPMKGTEGHVTRKAIKDTVYTNNLIYLYLLLHCLL